MPQQIPCWQKVELHSAPLPHVAPIGFLPQLPAMQLVGGTQSASLAQMTMHLPSLPQVNGAHDCAAGPAHVPSPSQRAAAFSIVPVQVCDAQTVPEAYLRQAPVPSQTPSVPQLCAPMSSHSLRGSVPRSASMQVPTAPCRAQVRQASVQALSQQTPSTQNPLAHSVASRHDVPSDCRPPVSAPEPSPPGPSFDDPSAAPAPVSIGASAPASPLPGLAPPPPHDTTDSASIPTSSVRTASMAPARSYPPSAEPVQCRDARPATFSRPRRAPRLTDRCRERWFSTPFGRDPAGRAIRGARALRREPGSRARACSARPTATTSRCASRD